MDNCVCKIVEEQQNTDSLNSLTANMRTHKIRNKYGMQRMQVIPQKQWNLSLHDYCKKRSNWNSWNCREHQSGRCFRKYFYGWGRNRDIKLKRFKTARLETIRWWDLLPLGVDQRRDYTVHWLPEQANKHHQAIKFTATVFKTETKFLDITVYKGERFKTESMLDMRTHFKPTETF